MDSCEYVRNLMELHPGSIIPLTRPPPKNIYRQEYNTIGSAWDDIDCRPLYANFIHADAMVSIHTNAAPKNQNLCYDCIDESFRRGWAGTEIYYSPVGANRVNSERLACMVADRIDTALADYPGRRCK